jgi:hypothetical protein
MSIKERIMSASSQNRNLFEKNSFGVENMSQRQLNEIALNKGGVVGSFSYGYDLRDHDLPEAIHGYGCRWIGTQGMGNCGTLVLTAKSAQAAEYLRQGKVKAFMERYDLSYVEADNLYDATRCSYGLEDDVIRYALENRHNPAWKNFPGVGRGVWNWHYDAKLPETGLSAPRLEAVDFIVSRLNF